MTMAIWRDVLIPFFGTTLGAACVFVMRKNLSGGVRRALAGFAAGVMTAASIWSLLLPAIEQSQALGPWAFVPAAAGFWAGVLFLALLEWVIPRLRAAGEGAPSRASREAMLVLAVTLHNLPEGMAVGVACAALLQGAAGVTAAGALSLAMGIAIQNIPEGAIISMPL
ncbi:MAG: ZIP family metal transporter [Clostridia bacterium]|nr:ZIP family metal transporter [Clostridia bacterium]